MLIVLGPLDRYEELFRRLWALLDGYRDSHGCFTFLSVYVKSIRSDYLARDGQDRFCELMFYTGVHPDKMTPELLEEIVEQFDDIVIENNAYKYMHTRTTKNPEKRAKVDPNARHAERRRAAANGAAPLKRSRRPSHEARDPALHARGRDRGGGHHALLLDRGRARPEHAAVQPRGGHAGRASR